MRGALEVVARRGPSVVALWALAVAQPVLDLFGRNPEFFVANDLGTADIVLFALGVVVVGPVVLLPVQLLGERLDARVGLAVHVVTVALLAGAFVLVLVNQAELDDSVVAIMVAAFAGASFAHLERRHQLVRRGLRYLAWSPILFLVAFLGFSDSAELVVGEPAQAAEPGRVGREAPVVVLSLDEFPVSSLLRPDGSINAQRFPGFARLAESATWYRNATSVASTTTQSVPATFTGRFPEEGELPSYRDHPRSLYTLLGDAYDQHVVEQVTDLCPPAVCPAEGGVDLGGVITALTDATAVYGHKALPPSLRDWLPVVDRSWGDFIDTAEPSTVTADVVPAGSATGPVEAPEEVPVALGPDPDCPDDDLWCGQARLSELIDAIAPASGRPGLYAGHATFPHFPWILTPTGQRYAPASLGIEGTYAGAWIEDVVPVRRGLQRHLLQVGAMDLLVDRLIDRLEEVDLWDEALVVVVADHGIVFEPGAALRAPEVATIHETYNVPLFVKAPGQEAGRVDGRNALSVDVLPTIVDLLDIETEWEFDGLSLLSDERRDDKPALSPGGILEVPVDFDGVLEVVARNRTYLPHRDDWLGVYAVGELGRHVGAPVTSLDVAEDQPLIWSLDRAASLADWRPGGGELAPLLVEGEVDLGDRAPDEALVALNGRVAGVAVGFRPTDGGRYAFSALLAEELLERGDNDVDLLVPADDAGSSFRSIGPPTPP